VFVQLLFSMATDVLYRSPAGSMLSYVIHSLLTLPVHAVRPLLHELLSLLPHLDRLNYILVDPTFLEEEEHKHDMTGKDRFNIFDAVYLAGLTFQVEASKLALCSVYKF
jgi:hypothetical protein